MKFSISFAMLALPLLVTAGPLVERATSPATDCKGSVQCCNSIQKAGPNSQLASLLGLNLQDVVNIPLGIDCNPITLIGEGNSCNQQTVCCSNNNINAVIAVGCSPFKLL